jgi:hypothetical protein
VAACIAAAAAGSGALASQLLLKGPPPTITQYGYVKSLKKKGATYELRFDPALWLEGETARRAAVDDGVINAGDPVDNDYYIRNPDKKLLTYRVPAGAAVTVVSNAGNRVSSKQVSVAALAAIVKGNPPPGIKLMDPGNHLGYWVKVKVDTALTLDQQYQP